MLASSGVALAVALTLGASVPSSPTAAFRSGAAFGMRTESAAQIASVKAQKPAGFQEVDRANTLIAQVEYLDPATLTPEVVAARDDLKRTLAAYLDQQKASEPPVSASLAPTDLATVDPTPTPSVPAPIAPTPEPSAPAPTTEPSLDPLLGSQEPPLPVVSGRTLPQDGVAAPDGSTPDEAVAGTAALGIVRLVDVVAAADRLATLLDIAIAMPNSQLPTAANGVTLADQLAQIVAKYGTSTDQYENGRIPASALCGLSFSPGHALRCDAAERLDALAAKFQAAFGHPLAITDSYRSLDAQIALKAIKPVLAAVPGTSQHGWGLAVDLGGTVPSGTSPEYIWLRTNAPDYGWDNPAWARPSGSKPEPWHFEFFGGGPMPTRYTPAEPTTKATVPPVGGTTPVAPVVPVDPAVPGPAPVTPTPTPTPSPSPTPTDPPSPTPSPTPTPTDPPSPTPTPTPSEEPTPTPTPSEEPTPTPTPSEAPAPTEAPSAPATQEPARTETSAPDAGTGVNPGEQG